MTGQRPAWTVAKVQSLLDGSPHSASLGLTCDEVDSATGDITLRMPFRSELARGGHDDRFHGGPVASLIDTAGDFAISVLLRTPVPTVNMRVDYLRPAAGPFLLARAVARRAGRTVGVADVDVLDSSDRLVALGRATYATAVR